MDFHKTNDGSTCSCTCLCCGTHASTFASFRRSVKRKLDRINQSYVESGSVTNSSNEVSARVEIENEAAMLREMLNNHQLSIQELYSELEEERSASETAASEAMSMILRLQREKAETQMEFRQYKRFAEEIISHDSDEVAQLEDLLYKKDQAVQSLSCEIQAYKHRLLSYGFNSEIETPADNMTPMTSNNDPSPFSAAAEFDYPALRCKTANDFENEEELSGGGDLEKYAFGETPKERIMNIEERISRLETLPSSSHDKGVVAFSSPNKNWTQHYRRFSMDSYGLSPYAYASKADERDDASDRVYTVDAVHCVNKSYMSTPKEVNIGNGNDVNRKDTGNEDEEIKRLYARLQALEADRETMRQTVMSMGTDKAQLVLLKEIAQQLCKEGQPKDVERKFVKKQMSFCRSFSLFRAAKWIKSFVSWRKKASRTKYTFGITGSNSGLLLLVDKTPRRQWRFLTRTLR